MQLALAEQPKARRSDPITSKDAARSVRDLTNKQIAVLSILKGFGPLTDVELLQHYRNAYGTTIMQADSGIRTRRKELVEKGQVRDTGETKTLPSGRKAVVWAAT